MERITSFSNYELEKLYGYIKKRKDLLSGFKGGMLLFKTIRVESEVANFTISEFATKDVKYSRAQNRNYSSREAKITYTIKVKEADALNAVNKWLVMTVRGEKVGRVVGIL